MKKYYFVSMFAMLGIIVSFIAQAKQSDYPDCSSKLTVAVDQFRKERVSLGWWSRDAAYNSRELAVDELVNSGCFTVLERDHRSSAPRGAMNEKALARSDEAVPNTKAALKHEMKTADYLVTYALTAAKRDASGFRIGGIGGRSEGFGGVGAGVKKSKLSLTCRIYDTASSEILTSSKVDAADTGFKVKSTGGGMGDKYFGVGRAEYFNDSEVGKMMSKAIHDCTVELAEAMAK